MRFERNLEKIIIDMMSFAKELQHEYVTPEHLLYKIAEESIEFKEAFKSLGGNVDKLKAELESYIKENVDEGYDTEPEFTYALNEVISFAGVKTASCDRDEIQLTHIIDGIMSLKESHAAYYILSQGIELTDLLCALIEVEGYSEGIYIDESNGADEQQEKQDESWKSFVTCINDNLEDSMPLIGRKEELQRTMQILCRKYKNNPIHIGEAGVGKTAITNGLVSLINKGEVPDKLKNAKVFAIDLGGMLAGTQYRGDFEKRFKSVIDGVSQEENPIIYIDEIHNIVGAGAINEGSLDVSNMLKPYLTTGKIRFIGATTYDEFNKYFSKSKSLLRRFQNVDIKETSIEETVEILNGLKGYYEDYHNIKYTKGTIEHAVMLSNKYINDRYLPDKAIDLIDEAGSYRVMNPLNKPKQTVDKKLIEEVVAKICNIPKQTVESDEIKKLSVLEKKLKEQVFGQEEAIDEVVRAIKLSRAGLNDDNKPVASMLFVGPTGVGKTEVARTLAKTVNIELIRFDMSEYVEKHSVAKLIGAPAGYVGYEEGGLLTDAVKKNPHCVLLLDEIEKAHGDIFNILLQVMDYATLTDNKGRKADFRNVILIMTSNAGASKVGKVLIGFGSREITRDGINEEVKRVFTPEFRNRLTKTVVFNNLDKVMATKIVEKQFKLLSNKLLDKNIEIVPSAACIEHIKDKGTSIEFGAREISRIIDSEIKSLLVDEILFGKLKKGGKCKVDYKDGKIAIEICN